MGLIQLFLWWLAGANIDLLKRCKDEWHIWTANGISVFVVWLLATVSGTFFFSESFDWSIAPSALGGFAIGLGVLSVDRNLLCHFIKDEKVSNKETAKRIAPRIILAIALALAIDHPMLLKIFEGSIDAKLNDAKTAKIVDARKADPNSDKISTLKTEIQQMKDRLKKMQDLRDESKIEMEKELGGVESNRTTGITGDGPIYKKKKQVYEAAETELAKTHNEIDGVLLSKELELTKVTGSVETNISKIDSIETSAADLIRRNNALFQMIYTEPQTLIVALILFVVLLGIDTIPITQKLLYGKTRYDHLVLLNLKEASIEFEMNKLLLDAEKEVFTRLIENVKSGRLDLENPDEYRRAKSIHLELLRQQGIRNRNSRDGSHSAWLDNDQILIKLEIAGDPTGTSARIFIPSLLENSLTLTDLNSQVAEFAAEVSREAGTEMHVTDASNSGGENIDVHFLPLVSQLKDDRRVLMNFGARNGSLI